MQTMRTFGMVLVLRPEPGASATAARAAALGLAATVTPLFTTRAIDWDAPAADAQDALLVTSANAMRLGGAGLARLAALPIYAVGAATAAAARAVGFARVIVGDDDAAAIVMQAQADGVTRLLHLAGAEHRAVEMAGGTISRVIIYEAVAASRLPTPARDALAAGAVALVHSPRAGTLLRTLAEAAGVAADGIAVAAISASAGQGWRTLAVAERPTDDALLAAAVRLCESYAPKPAGPTL